MLIFYIENHKKCGQTFIFILLGDIVLFYFLDLQCSGLTPESVLSDLSVLAGSWIIGSAEN